MDLAAESGVDSTTRLTLALRRHGYVLDGAPFQIGRPDRTTIPVTTRTGLRAVAKLFPATRGELTFANMQTVWRSSFGERRQPPGLPQPIEYLPDSGLLVMERIEGRPVVELGDLDVNLLHHAMELAAALHASEAQPRKRRSANRIVRVLREKVRQSAATAPQYGDLLASVVEAMDATAVEGVELRPCHGDFSPRNVLVGPSRVVVIDWDRLQWADPARDVAYFGAWCWVWALRRNMPADWSPLEQCVREYAHRCAVVFTEQQLAFHVAAGLVRMAHALVTLWPADAPLVPRLAAEALGRLRGVA